MARQQGLPESARRVNLEAIQNLNSYVDGVQKMIKPKSNDIRGNPYPFPKEGHTVEIEFVMPMDPKNAETKSSKISQSNSNPNTNNQFVVSTSRRKLEFLAPPIDMPPGKVRNYATRQFLKLLRISDLPIPASLSLYDYDEDDDDNDKKEEYRTGTSGNQGGRPQKNRRRFVSAWEASRERFWRRHNQILDHKKIQRMYNEALHDAEVHIRTRNWIRDNPKLRHRLLANVLSNVKFVESILPLERLVAYRRLLRFFDEHFDELRLEDSGKYWEEQATILVGEHRPFNTSPSALRKLRKQSKKKKQQRFVETGYSFAIHHDNKVTITIPIDFDNQELLQELLRNMEDFLQTDGTGLEGDYFSGMYGRPIL